jgi:serine acetyltransferase
MNQSGFNRYSALVIFWVSMSMSHIAFGEEFQNAEESASVNGEFIPIVYSGAAITMGAHSKIFGNIQSVAAVTLGEAAELHGSLSAGAAVTLDKGGLVLGNITAGEAATIGASSFVIGDLTAVSSVFIGAESVIDGNLKSDGDAKLGAGAQVVRNVTAGTSVTLGLNALVKGDAEYGTIISLGMNAKVKGDEKPYANPEGSTNEAKDPVATKKDALTQKQKELADRIVPNPIELSTTIDTSRDFYPGVYHASALTTTAGITLTFNGLGERNDWFINIDTYLSFGENLTINLKDVALGSTIVFNAGSYTTIGANSSFIGTIFAGTYITTGENTTIKGIDLDCGGMFATNGAITLGAGSTVGSMGCWPVGQQSEGNNGDEGEYGDEGNYDDEGEYGDEGNYGDEGYDGYDG